MQGGSSFENERKKNKNLLLNITKKKIETLRKLLAIYLSSGRRQVLPLRGLLALLPHKKHQNIFHICLFRGSCWAAPASCVTKCRPNVASFVLFVAVLVSNTPWYLPYVYGLTSVKWQVSPLAWFVRYVVWQSKHHNIPLACSSRCHYCTVSTSCSAKYKPIVISSV